MEQMNRETEPGAVIVNKMPETDLKTSDFYYDLPEELIAQHPGRAAGFLAASVRAPIGWADRT